MVKGTTGAAEVAGEAATVKGEVTAAVREDKKPAGELVGAVAEELVGAVAGELEPGAVEVLLGAVEVLLGGVTGAVGEVGVVLGERGDGRVPVGVLTGEAGEDPVLGDNADEARGLFGEVGVVGEELGLVLWGLEGLPEAVKAAVVEFAPGMFGETVAGVGIGL